MNLWEDIPIPWQPILKLPHSVAYAAFRYHEVTIASRTNTELKLQTYHSTNSPQLYPQTLYEALCCPYWVHEACQLAKRDPGHASCIHIFRGNTVLSPPGAHVSFLFSDFSCSLIKNSTIRIIIRSILCCYLWFYFCVGLERPLISCVPMSRTKEAGAQWISAHPSAAWNHVE